MDQWSTPLADKLREGNSTSGEDQGRFTDTNGCTFCVVQEQNTYGWTLDWIEVKKTDMKTLLISMTVCCMTLVARAAEKVSWIGDKKFIETADSFYDALAKGDARTAASHVYVKEDAKDGGLKLSFAFGRPFARFAHGVPRLVALPGIHVDGLDAGSCHVVAFCVPPSPKLAEVKGLKSAYTSNWIQGDIRYDAWVKVEDEWKVIADWNADEAIGSQKGSLMLTADAAKAAEMNESAIAGEKEKETILIDTLEEKIKQDSEK